MLKPFFFRPSTCSFTGMGHLLSANGKIRNSGVLAAEWYCPHRSQTPRGNRRHRPDRSRTNGPVPLYRVEVVERTTPAVNYLHRSGSSKVDFGGTPLMASVRDRRKWRASEVWSTSRGIQGYGRAEQFWTGVSDVRAVGDLADGRPVNLGELTLSDYGNGSSSKIEATSDIQNIRVDRNRRAVLRVTTAQRRRCPGKCCAARYQGVVERISAKYELLPRGSYTKGPGSYP
jgi:hypothetical protein